MQCFDTFRGFLNKLYAVTMHNGRSRRHTTTWGRQGIGHKGGGAQLPPAITLVPPMLNYNTTYKRHQWQKVVLRGPMSPWVALISDSTAFSTSRSCRTAYTGPVRRMVCLFTYQITLLGNDGIWGFPRSVVDSTMGDNWTPDLLISNPTLQPLRH